MGEPAVAARQRQWLRATTYLFRWVAGWQLWRLSRRVFLLVVAVHIVTVASVLSTAWMFSVERRDWIFAAVLLALALIHAEHSLGIGPLRPGERVVPYTDLKTVWNVAVMLVVPPLLATVVIVATHTHGFFRIHRNKNAKAHRWAYSCATVVLGSQVAALVLAAGIDTFPGVPGPTQLREWLVVFAAVTVRWLINYLLVILAAVLTWSPKLFADAFSRLGDQINEAAATGLAILVAVLLEQGYSVLLACVYIPARWGGEEFVVLVPEVNRESLHEIAERIRARVSVTSVIYTNQDPKTGETKAHTVTMTVSIGAALFEQTTANESVLDLVERADKLMYAAKAAGRDHVCSTLATGREPT